MVSALNPTTPRRLLRWWETASLLGAAWAVPVLVHLVPWAGPRPLGVYLLPAFWTVFVALHGFGLRMGMIVAGVTPAANLLMTGLPDASRLGLTVAELLAYCLACAWLLRRWPRLWLSGAIGFGVAKAVSVTIEWAVPVFKDPRGPLAHWVDSCANGLAGLAVLVALNAALCLLTREDSRRAD